MKKLIKIMLITFLVFSNVSISPTSAKEVEHSETSEVKLYLPNSDDLVLYEESELKEELTHVQNNSPALLLETDEETNSSLVEIELNEEKRTGYVQTEAVVEQVEYKLYGEKTLDPIQVYSDDTLKEELYELAEGTSVLVGQKDLKESIDVQKDYALITLNPETEAISKDLVDKIEDIQGFVKKENLVLLEDEAAYLEKRNEEQEEKQDEIQEEIQEETKENEEEQEKDEPKEKPEVVEEKQEETNESDNADETEKKVSKAEENSEPEVKEKELNRPSLFRSNVQETQTSLLGHINSRNGNIYKTLGSKPFKAGGTHTNKVYYVKKQAKYGNELYYLLSLNSKATNNLGWMKASDVKVQQHTYINRTSDKLSIKGNGKGTRMAWGGKKDTIHASMSSHKGKIFHINMKETVGKTTWYRGKVAGKGANVWLKANQVEPIKIKETQTSLLGHINSGKSNIYKTLGSKPFKAGGTHTNKVYYVKKQAKYGNELYYLLSLNSKATNNLGWMKASDVKVQQHTYINRTSDKLSIKGNGKGTRMAWGGKKDTIHASMSSHKGKIFHINMKETVGTTTWYRGKIAGKGANVWLKESQTQAIPTNTGQLIVLDAGHGGSDPGASRNGVVEKEVVLDVTLRAEKILKARGFRVILTRSTDTFINLSERSNIANRNNASSFLSIHANSGGGIGTETWWYNRNNAASSKTFAQVIQNAVVNSTQARDRGIKHGNLSVNRESNMTSALLEIGFVDSMTEAQQLKRPAYRNQIAIGIANGFDNYYR